MGREDLERIIEMNVLTMNVLITGARGCVGQRDTSGGEQLFLSVGSPFPAVCIRISMERPEALEKGNFILAGITRNRCCIQSYTSVVNKMV